MTDDATVTDDSAAVPASTGPSNGPATDPGAAAEPHPEPEPPPGLDELMAWLAGRTPATARAKIAQQIVQRIEDEIIDPAVVYAWEHRKQQATLRDLSAATGLNMARVTWALRMHPRADS